MLVAPSVLEDFLHSEPDEDACLALLWRHRFSDDGETAHCPRCERRRAFRREPERRSYTCTSCGQHLHPAAGTMFHKSSTPLAKWFRAIVLVAGADGDMPAARLQRELGVTYKTAWRMSALIHAGLDGARPRRPAREPGDIVTFAGDGTRGYGGDGDQATAAQLDEPYGVAVDGAGNVFVSDVARHVVRRVDVSGVITTIAGTGAAGYSGDDGPATDARLNSPAGVALDGVGHLLIADMHNHVVRRVDASGMISTVAGAGTVRFSSPARVLAADGALLISDYGGHRVYRVDSSGVTSVFAGNGAAPTSGDGGPAAEAAVVHPNGLAVDAEGNVYIAQAGNFDTRVRVVDRAGVITTFAGGDFDGFGGDGGPAREARLHAPTDVLVDPSGAVLIADYYNSRIRRVDRSGIITTIAGDGRLGFDGNGGPATQAALSYPFGLALTPAGDLLIAEGANHRVRRVIGSAARVGTEPV